MISPIRNPRGNRCRDWRLTPVDGCTVLGPVVVETEVHWRVVCPAGHEHTVVPRRLSKLLGRGQRFQCLECQRGQPRVVSNSPRKCCTICKVSGHNATSCPERVRKPRTSCEDCEGYPWRRPEDGSACACGGRYSPEEPVTLAYVAAHFMRPERVTVF